METLQQFISVFSDAWQQADGLSLVLFGMYFLALWIIGTFFKTNLKINNNEG